MGSELVGGSTSPKGSSKNATPFSILEELCPFYMSIGMTYHEYWYDDCSLARYYYQAYKLKIEREQIIANQNMWLQGLYVYEAILDASPIMHAFAAKGAKPIPYRDKPIPLSEDECAENEQELKNERLLNLFNTLNKSSKLGV